MMSGVRQSEICSQGFALRGGFSLSLLFMIELLVKRKPATKSSYPADSDTIVGSGGNLCQYQCPPQAVNCNRMLGMLHIFSKCAAVLLYLSPIRSVRAVRVHTKIT